VYCIYQVIPHRLSRYRVHLLTRGRYVLDIGQSQDWLALQVALAPCLLGYGGIAKRLHDDPKTKREGNIYWKWIENYVADDYAEAVGVGSGKQSCELVHHDL
jgi:thiaminase